MRLCLFLVLASVFCQQFDILLHGGTVIDVRNNLIGAQFDVAITDGKIAEVARSIPPEFAKRSVNVTGLIVTPGLIDVHAHLFWKERAGDIHPDLFCPRSGVTTAVDGGGVGHETFDTYFQEVVEPARTRVLTWLSIWSGGNSNTTNIDTLATARAMQLHPDNIVGIKIFSNGFTDYELLESGFEATDLAGGRPIILDWKYLPVELSIEDILLNQFRPGDVFTHSYGVNGGGENALVDVNTGLVKDFVWSAIERGVLFDAADGNVDANFAFRQAVPAIGQRFLADTISTDLTQGFYFSVDGSVVDLCTIMSKMIAAGMTLEEVVDRTTWKAAQLINRPDLGTLSLDAVADVAVLRRVQGDFGFRDGYSDYLPGSTTIQAEITLRAGQIVWDRESRFNRDANKFPVDRIAK